MLALGTGPTPGSSLPTLLPGRGEPPSAIERDVRRLGPLRALTPRQVGKAARLLEGLPVPTAPR